VIAVAFVALSGIASATETAYSLLPGQSMTYTVSGSQASLQQVTGSVEITRVVNDGNGNSDVTLHCLSTSPSPCTGFIDSR
jgi:hypothetical protein